MSFLKTLGTGMYYRIRRIKKALRNWRKFGVIIFGSMVLTMSAGLTPQGAADASSNLSYLYVDPAAISVEAGKTYQFTYRAYDGDWKPMTVAATWSMSKSQAGTISSTGLFTASAITGTYENAVKLSAGALSTYARVVVLVNDDEPVVTSKLTYLYVDPAAISVEIGHEYTFAYRAYDQNWKPMAVSGTWSMGKTQAGSIDNSGHFTASQTKGTYENAVKVSSGTLSAYARVVVYGDDIVPPPPAEYCSAVSIIDSNIDMNKNESRQIAYTATTNLGHVVSANNLHWFITGGSFNTATTTYTATQAGNFAITLSCADNANISDTANIHVSDNTTDEYLIRTDISADRNSIYIYEQTNLRTQAWSNLGRAIPDATYRWEKLSGVGYLAGDIYSQNGARFVAEGQTGSALVQVRATWKGVSVTNTMTIWVNNYYNPIPNNYFIDGSIQASAQDNKPICEDSVIVYTVTLNNRYNTVNNTTLTMTIPSALTILSASSYSNHPYFSGQTVTWTPGTLTTGQSVVLTVTAMVKDGIKNGTNLGVSAFVKASEKPYGFTISSNNLKVYCAGIGGPVGPLPTTGANALILSILAVISLGLAFLTYRWMDRRMSRQII